MKRIITLSSRFLRKLPWDNRGAIAIISGLVLVPVLLFTALVVDVGRMYYVRRDLQNIADAACLACAYGYGLSEDAAQALANANEALAKNNFVVGGGNTATITVPVLAGDPAGDYRSDQYPRVRVVVKQNTGLYFARIINHMDQNISARAVCELGNVKFAGDLLPFGVIPQNGETSCEDYEGKDYLFGYRLGELVRLKFQDPQHLALPGNTMALNMGDSHGAQDLYDNILNGSPPMYLCSQADRTKTGQVTNKTRWGVEDRLAGDVHTLYNVSATYPGGGVGSLGQWIKDNCPGGCQVGEPVPYCGTAESPCCPWDQYAAFPVAQTIEGHPSLWDCPRIGVVPFVAQIEQGSDWYKIVGFGTFWIADWPSSGPPPEDPGEAWVDGVFIRAAAADPDDYLDWGPFLGEETALLTVTLVK